MSGIPRRQQTMPCIPAKAVGCDKRSAGTPILRTIWRAGVALVASYVLFFVPACADQPICTDEACHQLDGDHGPTGAEVDGLIAALRSVDSGLAERIERARASGHCSSEEMLDRFVLVQTSINPESRVKVDAGAAAATLTSGEWNCFLIKVKNLAGVTAPLRVESDQAREGESTNGGAARQRWVQIATPVPEPLSPKLSGKPLEYRVLQLRADCTGKRSAILAMDVGQGTADIGFRNDVMLTFKCVADPPDAPVVSSQTRPARSEAELRYWLENMVWHHGYSIDEAAEVTGLTAQEVVEALEKFDISAKTRPKSPRDRLLVLAYPGGRHPRIGFLEGAVDPQRETKASIFTPWDRDSYVVVDVPEAIWSNLGLTYLAHTHIPTLWDEQDVKLEQLEWKRRADGSLHCERRLPNGIVFSTSLLPQADAVEMKMHLVNGTSKPLSDLRVQNCAMLKFAKGFAAQTNSNKVFSGRYAACRNDGGDRWIIMAWDPIHRAWGNKQCPCLHADPQFPDCPPGKTTTICGRLSFYEGNDIHAELRRIERTAWADAQDEDDDDDDDDHDAKTTSVERSTFDSETDRPGPARIRLHDELREWPQANYIATSAIDDQLMIRALSRGHDREFE